MLAKCKRDDSSSDATGRRTPMMGLSVSRRGRPLSVLVSLVALAAVFALPAGASPRGMNGQITFARFNADLGDTQVYVVNPDGTGQRLVQAPTDTGEGPRWFPDGAHIATGGSSFGGVSTIINPDDGTFRIVPDQNPGLFNPCGSPSPDGTLLLCETFSDDGSQNGIHTIRSSDGGGLAQITSTPGGDDIPGDWSPNGKRIVFLRTTVNALFVVNTNGTGLKQITPAGLDFSSSGSWSPQGNEIIFSQHVTPDVHSSIWVVHADGTGLHEINVQPASACGGANADPSAEGCNSPTWSPDGTKIAFVKGHSNDVDGEIYTVNVDGTGLAQVTNAPGSGSPDWGTHPPVG
jgi:Tol biopolymer transport system component